MVESKPGRQSLKGPVLEKADSGARDELPDDMDGRDPRDEPEDAPVGYREEERIILAARERLLERCAASNRERVDVDFSAAPARFAEVAEIAQEAVAHVDGGGGEPACGKARCEQGLGAELGATGGAALAPGQVGEASRGGAELAHHDDGVSRARTRTTARVLCFPGDKEGQRPSRRACDVAADEDAI